ncbi:putative ethylene response sensor 2 [Bienertia sinuspersici]
MELCNCVDAWATDSSVLIIQQCLNALTVVAYFAIPLELMYFIWISSIFPHKLVFIYLGTFSILCGSTYVWKYSQYPEISLVILIVQVGATKSEHVLKNRVEELNIEKSLMLREVATRRSIVRLINEIRSTIDGQCIVKSTVVGLGQIFDLEECSLWLPSETNKTLQLCHSFSCLNSVGSVVPISLPVVAKIFNNIGALRIPHTCPLVKEVKHTKGSINPEVVAIRVRYSFTEYDDSLDECAMSYAVMVLVPPSDNIRKFLDYELELLGAVAEQVSVALAHASAMEESTMACDLLKKQNSSMEVVLRDMKIALRSLEDSKVGIFHHLEMPLHAVTILSSFLLQTTLATQQREAAERILKHSTYLETLVQSEKHLSTLQDQDGIIELHPRVFNLSVALKQAVDFIKPAARMKRLSLSLVLTPDLPVYAVGDQGKLMQVILTVMANALKFTKEGHISVKASVAKPKTFRAWRTSKLFLFQVEDSGCGIDPQELPNLLHPPTTSNQQCNGKHGLAICKRLLEAMEGRLWVESDGIGKGSTATFIMKLGRVNENDCDRSLTT